MESLAAGALAAPALREEIHTAASAQTAVVTKVGKGGGGGEVAATRLAKTSL
mgnify:FL=1